MHYEVKPPFVVDETSAFEEGASANDASLVVDAVEAQETASGEMVAAGLVDAHYFRACSQSYLVSTLVMEKAYSGYMVAVHFVPSFAGAYQDVEVETDDSLVAGGDASVGASPVMGQIDDQEAWVAGAMAVAVLVTTRPSGPSFASPGYTAKTIKKNRLE